MKLFNGSPSLEAGSLASSVMCQRKKVVASIQYPQKLAQYIHLYSKKWCPSQEIIIFLGLNITKVMQICMHGHNFV